MISKTISAILIAVLLESSSFAQTSSPPPTQSVAKMQEVLRKAQAKDKVVKVTLNKKTDNQHKFSGKVSEVSDTGFTLTDQKTGKAMKLAYADVQQANQKGMSMGAKIAIVVGALIAVPLIIWAAAGAPR